ncbi:MAG: transcriptional regulator [Chloroflexi bacterium]|nr:transcriptional regulator [Chloroflexota bacterium]
MTERVVSGGQPAGPAETAPHAASPAASTLRRAILVHLRRIGPTSPDGLAAALGASRTGVLQQLHALESANLVQHALERHGVGRPRHLYDVTADAQDLFPEDYDGLASGLLAAIASIGGDELIEQVFAARRQQIGLRVKREMDDILPPGATLAERVMLLASIQDRAGYLADAQPEEGGVRLIERNCAIHHVAQTQPAACAAELALFREVLDADVVRESHIASGERCCSYRITARPD